MNFKLKLNITVFLAVGVLGGCENKFRSDTNVSTQPETDSILIWIESGRNRDNSDAFRKENLVKAYEVANLRIEDSIKLKYLSKIQWSFLGVQDSSRFRKTNKETNLLAQKVRDSVRLAGSYWDLGEFLNRNEVKDSAYFNLSKAQKIYASIRNSLNVGKLEYDMARIQADVKNYTRAEVGAIRSIEMLKPLEENLMLYRCYNLLGIVRKDLRDYDKSLEYYETAKNYLGKSPAKDIFNRQLDNNIGVTYQAKGEHAKAVSFFKKVLNQDSLLLKNPGSYASTLTNLARSSYAFDSDFNSEVLFLESLKIRDSLNDKSGLAGSHYELSKYYLEEKDTTRAIENSLKAKSYAEESENNERLLESLALLGKLDKKNASDYSQKYVALNDSLQLEERKIRNKFARIRFETDEVVAENELLARQKQLWAGIAISVLLLGTAGYVIIDQRAKNQKFKFQQEQQASNEKIFNLMLSEKQKFEEGKKIEQKRISEELHDGVLGKMLGARMVLTGLNKKANDEAISERADAIAALKSVEGEVRTISHELSHAAYQEIHNFIRSIADLLKNSTDAANIKHTFNYDEEIEWDDLKGDIKINLYRMVQEGLQNAIKHAQCQNINLDFSSEKNELKVLIEDDGAGFFLDRKKRKGIGMRNLQSRIDKLNGKLRIDSKKGEGTSIRLSIPIEYFSENAKVFKKIEKV